MEKLNSRKNINRLCYTALATLGFYISVYQNALVDITEEYALSSFTSSLIVSLHFIASFIFPFVIGTIADKRGRKPVLVLCFTLIILGVLSVMTIGNVFVFSLSIFIIGGAFCTVESNMSSLLSEVNPNEEAKIINLSQMYFCLGAVLGPIFGDLMKSLTNNWRGVYIIVLVLFASSFAWLYFSKLPPAPANVNKEESYIGKIMKSKYFLLLIAAMFFYVAIEEGAAFWIGEFVDTAMVTSIPSSLFLSMYWLGMTVGRLVGGLYKGNMAKFSSIMLASSVLFFLIILFAVGSVPVLIGFFLVGFGFAPVWPLIMSLSTTSFPDMPTTAAGGVMSAGAIGAAIAPVILGAVTEISTIKIAFVVLFMFLAALFVLQLLVTKKKR